MEWEIVARQLRLVTTNHAHILEAGQQSRPGKISKIDFLQRETSEIDMNCEKLQKKTPKKAKNCDELQYIAKVHFQFLLNPPKPWCELS